MENYLQQAILKAGVSLTPARKRICDALLRSGGHVTADQLVAQLVEAGTGIGRMTVFRTLDLLTGLGAIRPVYQGTGAAHYILLEDGHHHHLICSSCDKITELDQCFLEDVSEQIGKQFNFQVRGHVLELFGVCENCQSADT